MRMRILFISLVLRSYFIVQLGWKLYLYSQSYAEKNIRSHKIYKYLLDWQMLTCYHFMGSRARKHEENYWSLEMSLKLGWSWLARTQTAWWLTLLPLPHRVKTSACWVEGDTRVQAGTALTHTGGGARLQTTCRDIWDVYTGIWVIAMCSVVHCKDIPIHISLHMDRDTVYQLTILMKWWHWLQVSWRNVVLPLVLDDLEAQVPVGGRRPARLWGCRWWMKLPYWRKTLPGAQFQQYAHPPIMMRTVIPPLPHSLLPLLHMRVRCQLCILPQFVPPLPYRSPGLWLMWPLHPQSGVSPLPVISHVIPLLAKPPFGQPPSPWPRQAPSPSQTIACHLPPPPSSRCPPPLPPPALAHWRRTLGLTSPLLRPQSLLRRMDPRLWRNQKPRMIWLGSLSSSRRA